MLWVSRPPASSQNTYHHLLEILGRAFENGGHIELHRDARGRITGTAIRLEAAGTATATATADLTVGPPPVPSSRSTRL
jgi:hypothetical protein